MTARKTKGKKAPPEPVVLRGYAQIRALFVKVGFSPPPHNDTLRRWRAKKGLPITAAMGGQRVTGDARAILYWIRHEYLGQPKPKPPPVDKPAR